jgi:hypothetical protein
VLLAEIIGFGSSELAGGTGNDRLSVSGGDGNLLDGGPGRDRFQGGAGDDAFVIDGDDLSGSGTWLDGADGEDTVLVGLDLDLGDLGQGIANIERLDLTDGASNQVFLRLDDVLEVTDDAATLFVEGDGATASGGAGDAAALVGDWTPGPAADGFATFTLASATVNVDVDLATDVVAS